MNFRHAIPLLILLFIIPASAVTITERPDVIENGHPIYITITDLPDDAAFSLLIEASFDVQPNSEFAVQMSQFIMPFSLNEGAVTATLDGTSSNRLEVMKGDTIVAVSGKSVDGHYTTTKNYDITTGTYDYFRLSGVSLPTTQEVRAMLQVSGVKTGADDSEITFFVEGVPGGTIILVSLVDGMQILYKTVTVGSATPAPTEPQAGYSSGSAATATPTPAAKQEWKDFASADGNAKVRAFGTEYVGLVKVTAEGVPSGWKLVYGPYSIMPADLDLASGANLSFAVPGNIAVKDLGIFEYSDGNWTKLSSEYIEGRLYIPLSASGTYALLGPAPTTVTTEKTDTTVPVTTVPVTTPSVKVGIETITLVAGAAVSLGLAARRE